MRNAKVVDSIPTALNGATKEDLILAVQVSGFEMGFEIGSEIGFEIGFPKRRQWWRANSVQIRLGSDSTSRVSAAVNATERSRLTC